MRRNVFCLVSLTITLAACHESPRPKCDDERYATNLLAWIECRTSFNQAMNAVPSAGDRKLQILAAAVVARKECEDRIKMTP